MNDKLKDLFNIPLQIDWHEGMLLSQHHFQQNDLRFESLVTHQVRLLSQYHYGVFHLRLDNTVLTDGVYRIVEIEAVLPDGLIFSYDANNELKLAPIEINIAEHMAEDDVDATVYLCINESDIQKSPMSGQHPRFYAVDGEQVSDYNHEDNKIKIPRLFPNVFLSINKTPELCSSFPLARIQRVSGVYSIKNWTPPCFFIRKHFPLWERCRKLTNTIREKAVFLAEKIKRQNLFIGSEQMLKQLLFVLPGLEALVYSDFIRPYDLYKELAKVLGAVSVLRVGEVPPSMHAYNHSDIDGTVYPIVTLIEHYLSTIERGFSIITMQKKERFFYYFLSSTDISRCKENVIYAGVRCNNENYKYIENWMDSAVIVSDFAIEKVRERRTNGAKRCIADSSAQAKILPGMNVMLFEIYLDEKCIKGEQNFHIFNPGDNEMIRPVEITLYIPSEKEHAINSAA